MEQGRDRQHVVHDGPLELLVGAVELDVEPQRLVQPVGQRVGCLSEAFHLLRLDDDLAGHVQADHVRRELGGEDGGEGFGIAPGVELGVGRGVAACLEVADHRDVPRDLGAHQRRITPQRQCQARHGTERHERDRLVLCREQPIERLHPVEDHPRPGHLRVPQPGLAVRLEGHRELSLERPSRPDGDRHPARNPGAPQDLDRVAVGVLDQGVAVGDGDAAHVELGGVQGEPEGEAVVDAGIGIDDYGEWGVGSGRPGHELKAT